MKKMPAKIKKKLRQLQKCYMDARVLDKEISEIMESYGINIDNLCAMGDLTRFDIGHVQTEALTYITNGEGNVEDNIVEIEEVFLYYVNKK